MRTIVKWVVLGVALSLVIGLVPVGAQGNDTHLTQEQQDWLERVFIAHARVATYYEAFYEEARGQSQDAIIIRSGDDVREVSKTRAWSRQAATVRASGAEYINAQIALNVLRVDGDTDYSYAVNAAARVVAGVLYVQAAYAEPLPAVALPELTAGWVLIETPGSLPIYEDLHLDDLLDMPSLLDDEALVRSAATDVELVTEMLPDRTQVDQITITFDRDGVETVLRAFLSDDGSQDPVLIEALLSSLDDGSSLVFMTKLDDENHPLVFQSIGLTRATGLDATFLIGNVGIGATLDIIQDSKQEQWFSRVNDPTLQAAEQPPLGQ